MFRTVLQQGNLTSEVIAKSCTWGQGAMHFLLLDLQIYPLLKLSWRTASKTLLWASGGQAPCESLCFFRHTCKSSRENRNKNKFSLSSLTCHQEQCGKNWLGANNRSWVIRNSMLCFLGQSKTAFWDKMRKTLMVITSSETPWCVYVNTNKRHPRISMQDV